MAGENRSPETRDELVSVAKEYAKSVPIDVSLDELQWTVSDRAKRRAGGVKVARSAGSEEVIVDLNWSAFQELDWETFQGVIRHELIHVWQFEEFGEMNHGSSFKAKAEELNAPRHCQQFTEHRYELECASCGKDGPGRHQRSKIVKQPERYEHPDCECGPGLRVHDTKTGNQWETHQGFVDAFDDTSELADTGEKDRYRLKCAGCGTYVGTRQIRSAPVKQPGNYTCSGCGCPDEVGLRVIDTEEDKSWT